MFQFCMVLLLSRGWPMSGWAASDVPVLHGGSPLGVWISRCHVISSKQDAVVHRYLPWQRNGTPVHPGRCTDPYIMPAQSLVSPMASVSLVEPVRISGRSLVHSRPYGDYSVYRRPCRSG